jgi:hypothetical protein
MRREQRSKTRRAPADDDYRCAINAQFHLLRAAQIAGDAISCVLAEGCVIARGGDSGD